MARKANYEEKIKVIEAKIAKKQEDIKKLRATLTELKNKKTADDLQELASYMDNNNLTPSEVLASIKG